MLNLLFQFIRISCLWYEACHLGLTPIKITWSKLGLRDSRCASLQHSIHQTGKWLTSHAWKSNTNVVLIPLAWSAVLCKCPTEKQWEHKIVKHPIQETEPFSIRWAMYHTARIWFPALVLLLCFFTSTTMPVLKHHTTKGHRSHSPVHLLNWTVD